MTYLTAEQILFIHHYLIEKTGGRHGVRDLGLLTSAVGRPQASFDGNELYTDMFDKAAALFESLIGNHPFVDGNKRTAITAAGIFLERNGWRLTATNEELEQFTLQGAESHPGIPTIAAWFRDHGESVA